MDIAGRLGGIDLDALRELLTPEVIALLVEDNSSRDGLRVLTRPQVIALLGISKTTFDRIEARGQGPRKVRLSARRIGYRACDVKRWLTDRTEGAA